MRSTSETFKIFKAFREGREFKKVTGLAPDDLVPWLNSSRREHPVPPFADHVSFFRVINDTRIAVAQPYIEAAAHEAGIPLSQDLKKALLERWEGHEFPDTSPIKLGIEAVVRAAQRESDKFANRYGLTAKVSFPGWYAAGRVLLIEYKRISVSNESTSGVVG